MQLLSEWGLAAVLIKLGLSYAQCAIKLAHCQRKYSLQHPPGLPSQPQLCERA